MSKRMKFITKTDRLFYKADRDALWLKQDFKCHYCEKVLKRTEATLDHKKSLSRVHRIHNIDNCVVACSKCNNEKGSKLNWIHETSISETEKFLKNGLSQLEERIKLAEFRLSFDTKGSFSKWKKYWNKHNRWKD